MQKNKTPNQYCLCKKNHRLIFNKAFVEHERMRLTPLLWMKDLQTTLFKSNNRQFIVLSELFLFDVILQLLWKMKGIEKIPLQIESIFIYKIYLLVLLNVKFCSFVDDRFLPTALFKRNHKEFPVLPRTIHIFT